MLKYMDNVIMHSLVGVAAYLRRFKDKLLWKKASNRLVSQLGGKNSVPI